MQTGTLNYFRHHPLRKGLWLIILFGSLLSQTQNLFACDLMDSGPQTTCCCDEDMGNGCPMGGGCDTSDSGLVTGCCEVSTQVDVGLQDVAMTDSHHNKQVLSLDAPQPPPAIIITSEFLLPLSDLADKLAVNDFSISVPSPGTHTYLVTNRFRI